MVRRSKRGSGADLAQVDLFAAAPSTSLGEHLDALSWPDQQRVPVNRASAKVRHVVWPDLSTSRRPVVVAGYASIGELVSFIAEWARRDDIDEGDDSDDPDDDPEPRLLRLVFGTEPYATNRHTFVSPELAFTAEVEQYWHERGISVRQSALLLAAIAALDHGLVSARFVHGNVPLHAKVFVGDTAATLGSSNFTTAGLGAQLEANVRVERDHERRRYDELVAVAENCWVAGHAWDAALRRLLESLLQVVTWHEALARACVELLDGEWAERYLASLESTEGALWPSQRIGIAQALWIIESVGSVLVADATGSGKTRMGAQLVRAVRDRLWATGRVRRDLTVLVCPPSVEDTWRTEAISCGLSINTVSHGKLSRAPERRSADLPIEHVESSHGRRHEERHEHREVRRAQLLAVDEAHNFLNRTAKRTRFLRENLADHVLLFTATPISRGPADLLDLVALLGPDNFPDRTLDVLRRLERRRGLNDALDPAEADELRAEIQRFTLRRTKTQINHLVEREPAAYEHPVTGRVCRYPEHRPHAYPTGETDDDAEVARSIRSVTAELVGVTLLGGGELAVPPALRSRFSDAQWLDLRLGSARGLAAHHVLAALRSSRAALFEHLRGTVAAAARHGLPDGFKTTATGDVLGRLDELVVAGPPSVTLDCEVPTWLTDADAWAQACRDEQARYLAVLDALDGLSDARERTKVALLTRLAAEHERVLAFDHHLITLAVLRELLTDTDADADARSGSGVEVLVATGQRGGDRREVERVFALSGRGRAIALCSDAMNEGLNLQGAAAIVHLDLPTTLRVAEQRVGRVDRMDTPHDVIEAWWPRDGEAFATRANERLLERLHESESLLGSNLPVPDLGPAVGSGARVTSAMGARRLDGGALVTPEDLQAELVAAQAEPWDGIADALEPVRRLVESDEPLVPPDAYRAARGHGAGVRSGGARRSEPDPAPSARSVVAAVEMPPGSGGFGFFAVRSAAGGAPRWLLVEPDGPVAVRTELVAIAERLRVLLGDDPPGRTLDDATAAVLDRCLALAAASERELLPKRMQRALEQVARTCAGWADGARRAGREDDATRWLALRSLVEHSGDAASVDSYALAERWLELVAPVLDAHRSRRRRQRYVLLRDIDDALLEDPFEIEVVEAAFSDLAVVPSLAERVSACIIGVPD